MELLRDWQSQPLEATYPIVYLDALFVSTRDGGHVTKRAFYLALGVGLDGRRDVLGLWAAPTEDTHVRRSLVVMASLTTIRVIDGEQAIAEARLREKSERIAALPH